jgi:RNA polymerase sigma factor (sigma-70 family)
VDDELAVFCEREHRRLVAALDLVCGSLPMAEDLAQETLARVCRHWSRIRLMEAPGAYAHRIALNLAKSSFRRHSAERRARDRLTTEAASTWSDPDSASTVAVRAALHELRPEQRRVLVLRHFLGYSVAETAELLGMPEGSVKTHAFRGLAQMRASLGTEVTVDEEGLSHG